MTLDENIIKQALKKRAHFDRVEPEVLRALASYYGGDTLYSQIFPLPAEDSDVTILRRKQTLYHYQPHPKSVAGIYIESSMQSKQDQRIVGKNKELNEYLKGPYYSFLTRDPMEFSLLIQDLFIRIEKPLPPPGVSVEEIISPADQAKLKLIPQPFLIFPQYVQNYACGRDGILEWICIKEPIDEQGSGIEQKYEFTVITKDEIATLTSDFQLKELKDTKGKVMPNPYKHGYVGVDQKPAVPVVKITYQKNHFYGGKLGYAPLTDVVNLSIGNLQFISLFIEAAYQHLSLKLRMGRQTLEASTLPGQDFKGGNLQLIIEEEGQFHIPTSYVAMPNIELDTLIKIVFQFNPEAIFRAARLQFDKGSGNLSGIAKLMKARPEAAMLSKIIEFFWQWDEGAVGLIAANYGPTKGIIPDVSYPAEVMLRSATEQMADVVQLVDVLSAGTIQNSKTGNAEIMKGFYNAMLPNLSAKVRDAVNEEIDNFQAQGIPPETATEILQDATKKDGLPYPGEVKKVVGKAPKRPKP